MTPGEAVDALLAAGMLTDPDAPPVIDGRTLNAITAAGYKIARTAPRDDEARIERAALAALDGILIALGWALDDVEYPKALNAARAALAAADQEEKP